MENAHSKVTVATLLVTMGIVYGDIGTSPLYVMSAILGKSTITKDLILGALSCVVWTLTLVTTIKYVMLVLRADNHGEGGVFSLYNLVKKHSPKWTIYLAMLGCAALLADGMITPAITVTSAIEGLVILSPNIPVVPIVIGILIGLFSFQQFGTEKVGKMFGPVMLAWFLMLSFWGGVHLVKNPGILAAINPMYAYQILSTSPSAWLIVGAVFLCTTGAEALYSDLGHVGKSNIRISWIFVKSALLVNYFGQGAWVLENFEGGTLAGINPFYGIMPKWFVAIGVFMAVAAAVIASQALISGAYSLINEAIKLESWFKVQIRYPSRYRQQLFIPMINHMLFLGCCAIVLIFQKSSNMEHVYGLAITIAMLSDTILLTFFLKRVLNWGWFRMIGTIIVFFVIEGFFFASNAQKIAHGAGFTLIIMSVLMLVMLVHYQAKRIVARKRRYVDIHHYEDIINAVSTDKEIPKFATNIVYMTNARNPERMEKQILKSIYQKQPKRADAYWLLHFNETETPFQEEYRFAEILPGKIFRIDFFLGYKVKPNVKEMFTEAIKELEKKGVISLQNRYESLKKHHVPADFLFIVMRNTFNLSSESPISEVFLLNGYNFLQHIGEPPEKYLGIDRNSLLVEFIALR